MKPPYITEEFINAFISSALREDQGDGDHSSLASIPEKAESQARLLIKDDGILAGMELAWKIFHFIERDEQRVDQNVFSIVDSISLGVKLTPTIFPSLSSKKLTGIASMP